MQTIPKQDCPNKQATQKYTAPWRFHCIYNIHVSIPHIQTFFIIYTRCHSKGLDGIIYLLTDTSNTFIKLSLVFLLDFFPDLIQCFHVTFQLLYSSTSIDLLTIQLIPVFILLVLCLRNANCLSSQNTCL